MFDVIVLDLDGTLLKNDKTVSDKTMEALRSQEKLGKQIVIATARPPRLGDIMLSQELQREFMIFYNGAEIYHNREMIYSKFIPLGSLESIRNLLLKNHSECRVSFEINDRLYSNYSVESSFGNIEYEAITLDSFKLKPAAKVLVDMSSINDVEALKANLPQDCQIVITDNGSLGQIMTKGVNKLNALKYILDLLGTTLDRVVFFGDDINDIELIKECGIGVAMGNAALIVKEAADFITKSNEEDGIAAFLE